MHGMLSLHLGQPLYLGRAELTAALSLSITYNWGCTFNVQQRYTLWTVLTPWRPPRTTRTVGHAFNALLVQLVSTPHR